MRDMDIKKELYLWNVLTTRNSKYLIMRNLNKPGKGKIKQNILIKVLKSHQWLSRIKLRKEVTELLGFILFTTSTHSQKDYETWRHSSKDIFSLNRSLIELIMRWWCQQSCKRKKFYTFKVILCHVELCLQHLLGKVCQRVMSQQKKY